MNYREIKSELEQIADVHERIAAINEIKRMLKEVSPFNDEPVECVQWVKPTSFSPMTTTPTA